MSRARLLRFSGSKADVIDQLLGHKEMEDSSDVVFFDVFTGSGSVAEGVAKQYKNVRIVMNDLDQNLYALHHVIAHGSDDDFNNVLELLNITPTIEVFKAVVNTEPTGYYDRAFRAMFLNRTCDSRASGLRPLGGWKQEGAMRVTSRYKYHNIVKTMLERRMLLRGRTTVTLGDFRPTLTIASISPQHFVYCDPVYVDVGNDLYHNTPKWETSDHVDLRNLLVGMDNNWLLNYNDHPFVRTLYSKCDIYPMRMPSQSQGGAKIELLIKPRR